MPEYICDKRVGGWEKEELVLRGEAGGGTQRIEAVGIVRESPDLLVCWRGGPVDQKLRGTKGDEEETEGSRALKALRRFGKENEKHGRRRPK